MTLLNSDILPATIKKADIPAIYTSRVALYDIWGNLTETKARRRCLELANIQDGESVLEVAVGTGLAFVEILKQNPNGRNEGIDLTQAMLDQAVKKAAASAARYYTLKIGDAYALDFADNSFDLVINNYMFDLLPESDFPQILSEFKRVLRPGGRLVLANMTKGERWYHGLAEAVYRLHPASMGGCRGVALLGYVQAAGFAETQRHFTSQLTFPSEIIYGINS
jgi:ubiquinone/menaquinone biosynthesis C-methylase UbiE